MERRHPFLAIGLLALPLGLLQGAPQQHPPELLVVGSKPFTESRLLGTIMQELIEAKSDLEVRHKSGLGGTLLCHEALLSGQIDLYAEYTGTAWTSVLKHRESESDPLRTFLTVQSEYAERFDCRWLHPFGFSNTYVLAMDPERAARDHLTTISDLARVAGELRAGFSIEFLNRADGLPGLRERYALEFGRVRGMEHALAYQALGGGQLDLIDAYSTDAKLARLGLLRLRDDMAFFPPYDAAPVIREASLVAHPELAGILGQLAFRIDEDRMAALNLAVEEEGRSFEAVAHNFLLEEGLIGSAEEHADGETRDASGWLRAETRRLLWSASLVHLRLTSYAMLLASLVGLGLALWLVDRPRLASGAIAAAGMIQTLPGLALLALMVSVPGLGLSLSSAILALFLYSLLPILRGAYVGLSGVAPELVDAARGMGLTRRQVLLHVRLPLALPSILGGIRTAWVIAIGLGTLAAFIGAGGLGELIITGLYLNDPEWILAGAGAAALMALATDGLLGCLQRWLTPRGLGPRKHAPGHS